MKLGGTGNFPDGKSRNDDEGELAFAIGVEDRLVSIQFGKPVAWFSMPPALARQFAAVLIQNADKAEKR